MTVLQVTEEIRQEIIKDDNEGKQVTDIYEKYMKLYGITPATIRQILTHEYNKKMKHVQ